MQFRFSPLVLVLFATAASPGCKAGAPSPASTDPVSGSTATGGQATPGAGTDAATVAASASAAGSAPAPNAKSESQTRLACLAKHYRATASTQGERPGLLAQGVFVPYDDGKTLTAEQRLDAPDLRSIFAYSYRAGPIAPVTKVDEDPGRIRVEALLRATYGANAAEVQSHLVPLKLRGQSVMVHEKARPAFERVFQNLERIAKEDAEAAKFLAGLGGTFNDRVIAGTHRQSAHAFGIAIDLNPGLCHYYRNDAPGKWQKPVPASIVRAFEEQSFVWGGRWYHDDTMHFEYRPEFFDAECQVAASSPTEPKAPAAATATPGPAPAVSYAWQHASSAEALNVRFASPPAGFQRVAVAPGTFGAFLRTLPLMPPDALVVDYRGNPLYNGGRHENIAAVVDIDIGTQDLQQCADSVLRMHGEWRFSDANHDITYKAASGTRLSYQDFVRGDRAVADGNKLQVKRQRGALKDDHGTFRSYLDEVFAWANTASIERDGTRVAFDDMRAGDYFVLPGVPVGHAVLILDMAKHEDGRVALLLGQGYMPAQSFHVLRSSQTENWFVVQKSDGQITTPFWKPFPFTNIRRLP